jgi:catechol 2,3-dioxygenase-like lactoylglutathione lyase family enzyme
VIDHMTLCVRDIAKSKAFYEKALAPLGFALAMDLPQFNTCAFGPKGRPQFWISQKESFVGPTHVAFESPDRKTVDAWFAAAVAAGASDNGGPGPRPEYHPGYYGAFVLDPDGHNIEAVTHRPE